MTLSQSAALVSLRDVLAFGCGLSFAWFAVLVVAGPEKPDTSPSPFNHFNPGNGLVELAALTTLIGSQTAEYLALGNRGPVGLPWACMSAFGSFSVVRTCLMGASPDWLRETLGARTQTSDTSLGMSLDLVRNFRGASRIKRSQMEARGISCENVCVDMSKDYKS
jgi:hypothetical protein